MVITLLKFAEITDVAVAKLAEVASTVYVASITQDVIGVDVASIAEVYSTSEEVTLHVEVAFIAIVAIISGVANIAKLASPVYVANIKVDALRQLLSLLLLLR